MPVVEYILESGLLRPWQYVGSSSLAPRSALIPGQDQPGPSNTGPYTVNSFQEVYPPAGSSVITISSPGTYHGQRYWGRIQITQNLPDWSVKFTEPWFCGPPPEAITANAPELIRGYGTRPSKFEIHDGVFDPSPWLSSIAPGGARSALSPYYTGLRGGNARIFHTEFKNVHDAWNWIGPDGGLSTTDPGGSTEGLQWVDAQEHLSYMNWYHAGLYMNDVYPPADGQPHSDGIQTNFGRNFRSIGDFVGGPRVMTGYHTWPGGYNAGDDYYGAGYMIKQENGIRAGDNASVYVPRIHELMGIIVEDGFIEGCTHGINMSYEAARPASYAGSAIRRMKFAHPRGSNWGETLRGDGPGTPPRQQSTGAGTYIIRNSTQHGWVFGTGTDANRLYDGSLVPISQGA